MKLAALILALVSVGLLVTFRRRVGLYPTDDSWRELELVDSV